MAAKHKFSSKITFSSNASVVHHGTKLINEVLEIALKIPQEILIYWHTLQDQSHNPYTYADLLNSSDELSFTIKHSPSFEKRVNDVTNLAKRDCQGKSRRKKQQLLKKTIV